MRGHLYLCCFGALAAGIALERLIGAWSFLPWGLLLLACAVAAVVKKRPGAVVVIPVCFAVAGTLLLFMAECGMRGGLLPRAARERAGASVAGRVLSLPSVAGESASFFMEVHSVHALGNDWRTGERLYVTADGRLSPERIFPGMNIEARGRLAAPGRDERWLQDHGCACVMRTSPASIKRAGPAPDMLSRSVAAARRKLSESYRRIFDERVAGFIEGVSLSKLDRADPAMVADLRACGLSHLVAVAGLHVSSAAVLALAALAALGAGRKTRFIAAAIMALVVLALSNFRPSAMRATIMAAACFGGAIAGRRYNSLIGVSIAGIAILCANPRALLDPTFQYSFAAALGIVLAMSSRPEGGLTSKPRLALAVCAGAQLGILPLALLKGQPAPVSAIVANLLVVWLVGFLLLSSWLAALLTALSLPLAKLAAVPPSLIARYILSVASACARVPGAGVFMGALSAAALVLYVASLVMFARRARGGSLFRPAVCLGLAVLLVLFACFPVLRTGNSGAPVSVMDVDEGDAVLLHDARGGVVLVDGGPDADTIIAKLRSRGISRIDLMVLTHPHSDHAAGLVEVMRTMPVGRLVEPGLPPGGAGVYHDLLDLAREKSVPVTAGREGQVIEVDPLVRLEVLYAPASLDTVPENLNDCSIVSMAYIQGMRVLLCGDIESTGQKTLLGCHPDLDCDVIKIPHQGAANAATRELLEAARPRLATISVGRHNTFGHPSARCLSLLASRGVTFFRTDLSGDIEISCRNGRITVKTHRR